ncbi:hypothetical protein [Methylobacterium sp. OT2]|uniref:hypothetical protein n=1 Tax=Methylobacterium sp. OT2 TaxID=2813779 RepID=UPI00197B601E|nr:hypothetical protein [Methylobacterium sp. OT2]MBN4095674.1 hypothetical protein [Methylobacterium sp. OT2]
MSDETKLRRHQDAIQQMMRRLDGYVRGLGLDEAATHQIIEKIASDMPERTDEEQLEAARRWLLAAASA